MLPEVAIILSTHTHDHLPRKIVLKQFQGNRSFVLITGDELPGALQALGRAKVIGNRTAGLVLVAGVLPLEIGATLVYPSAETRFMNGYVPEGKGITPDVNVPWSRPFRQRPRP